MTSALDLLTALYEYSAWARDQLLDAAGALTPEQLHTGIPGVYGSIYDTVVHMAVSQWMWLERVQGRAPQALPSRSDFADLGQLRAWWDTQHAATLAVLATLTAADLDRPIHYTNAEGKAFTRRVWHALIQAANHQTEHRSEIATMLTQYGVAPPPTGLVNYLPQG